MSAAPKTSPPRPHNTERRRTDDLLFERYLRDRDPAVRAQLIERFLPLARTVAARFRRPSQPMDDIFQVACLGLVKAVDRFDPARGAAFSTYAVPTISGEIRRYFRDATWSVRPPRDLLERALRVQRAVEDLTERDAKSPTVADIVAFLGDLDDEEVLEALQARKGMDAISLQERLDDEEGAATREERMGGDDEGYEVAENRAMLEKLMRGVSERDREVLSMRYFQDMTQAEIGERLGVSQMQVSRIVRAALTRMETMSERSALG